MKESEVLWRTLVRILSIGESKIQFVIPGWNHESPVIRDVHIFPEGIHQMLTPGLELHVRANIGAYKSDDLVFEDWEVVPP